MSERGLFDIYTLALSMIKNTLNTSHFASEIRERPEANITGHIHTFTDLPQFDW
jgi:hypothetical protein